MKNYKTWEEWLKALGQRESSGRYDIVNSSGYLGKYQMGGGSLSDAGYYKLNPNGKENDWKGQFTGKDSIYSKEDFLNNPQAQDNAIKEYNKKQWSYLKSNGSTKAVGSKINGIDITSSGLLAGAHLVGNGGVGQYVNSKGKSIPKDKNGTSVEEYIKKFGNYDVSELIDPNYYAPKFGGSKEDVANRVLNQGANVISGVANQDKTSKSIPSDVVNNSPIPPPLSMEEWMKRLKRHRMGLE